jgi:hypothetical protein
MKGRLSEIRALENAVELHGKCTKPELSRQTLPNDYSEEVKFQGSNIPPPVTRLITLLVAGGRMGAAVRLGVTG